MTVLGSKLINSVELSFIGKMAEAKANLSVYLDHPVGVGEHSSIVEEVINAVDDYQKALNGMGVISRIKSSMDPEGLTNEPEAQGED